MRPGVSQCLVRHKTVVSCYFSTSEPSSLQPPRNGQQVTGAHFGQDSFVCFTEMPLGSPPACPQGSHQKPILKPKMPTVILSPWVMTGHTAWDLVWMCGTEVVLFFKVPVGPPFGLVPSLRRDV